MPQNEIDKFFEGLPGEDKQEQDVFNDKPQETPPVEAPVVPPEEGGEANKSEIRKNRRERRLEEQLQRERESNIALNERVKVLAEVGRSGNQIPTEVPSEWTALMGDSPEAQKAWQLQQKLLQSATDNAKKEALREFQEQQDKVLQEQKQFEQYIDTELETLEDEYNVDLTSNAPTARKARREFLELVQNLSPKDENGSITGYADFDSTFKLYQQTRKQEKPNNTVQKQKEIASKTMQQPTGAPSDVPQGPMNWGAAKAAINRLLN